MSLDENQGRRDFGARLFQLRFGRLRISQKAFADRYGLTLGVVKDLEQGRRPPTSATILLVAMIEAEPRLVAGMVAQERAALAEARRSGNRWQARP